MGGPLSRGIVFHHRRDARTAALRAGGRGWAVGAWGDGLAWIVIGQAEIFTKNSLAYPVMGFCRRWECFPPEPTQRFRPILGGLNGEKAPFGPPTFRGRIDLGRGALLNTRLKFRQSGATDGPFPGRIEFDCGGCLFWRLPCGDPIGPRFGRLARQKVWRGRRLGRAVPDFRLFDGQTSQARRGAQGGRKGFRAAATRARREWTTAMSARQFG